MVKKALFLCVCVVLLAACGPAATLSPTAAPTTVTPSPTASPIPRPTITPITPRFATVTPTRATPTPTPKPTIPAEGNVELVGHVGGDISAISLQGTFAYVGQGRELGVWDVADARAPVQAGYVLVPDPDWSIRDVAVWRDHAYVAVGDAGLWIVDVSDPAAPVEAGLCRTEGDVRAVVASDDRAYVLDSPTEVRVLDISEPNSCQEVFAYTSPGEIAAFAVRDEVVYLAVRLVGLDLVDPSDPASPRVSRYYAAQHGETRYLVDVIVEDDYAFLLGTDFLEIVDVSDPAHPVRVGELEELRGALTLALAGDTLFVGRRPVINVIDVSDRSAPVVVGSIEGEILFPAVAEVAAGRLHIVDWQGLHVFDLADPTSPREVASVDILDSGWAVAAVGETVFIGRGEYGPSWAVWGRISVVDVARPMTPVIVGAVECPNAVQDVVLAGGKGFAVDAQCQFGAASCWGVLTVFDASAPASGAVMAELPLDGLEAAHSHSARWGGRGVAVEGDCAVVVGSSFYDDISPGNTFGLLTIDVSDPAAPRRAGALYLPQEATEEHWWSGYAVALAHGHAYVAAGEKGLRVVDVSDCAAPVEIGALGDREVYELAVANNWAYIADAEGWLWVVDISVPSAPSERSAVALPAKALDVAASDGYAYVVAKDAGLLVFDVSDPMRPQATGFFPASGAQAVAVVGDMVYLVDSDAGLFVLRLEP